ncbi:saccharopine dehydrogenase [Paenibacillus sp. FSL R7-277]|uniref:saccharopine dehydrogenase n=1 Tax=unclassified Paenibacillus TaxID=185978 RepID=UPI0003E1E447|nr:saccharopine dehydrogenase [Paenibacillus sp. FSL R7-277]ETT72048.1 saccharopine dehydrogenase [Paenibacillus sp. FSL R7-277]
MNRKKVLIAGGYGAVGVQIARILHDRHPDLELVLGGRSAGKAAPFPSDRVHTVVVDTQAVDPLIHAGENITLIINAVNDLDDRLLVAAVRRKIPLIDVTRWTEVFQQAIRTIDQEELHAPVILSSGWMAGTASLFAMMLSKSLQNVEVNIHALYSLRDKAGPDSAAFMDRMSIPFHITQSNTSRLVYPMTDPVKIQFPNGYATHCYRLDTPDHVTLPRTHHIDSASFRISFDHKVSTYALAGLVKTGIWKMISGDRFKPFRRKLLYNPGTGSAHHLVILLKGMDAKGNVVERRMTVSDPLGQTHMTALGAAVQAENLLLMMSTDEPMAPGIYYPEHLFDHRMDMDAVTHFFTQYGVQVSYS